MKQSIIQVAVVGCGAALRELHLPWLRKLERGRQLQVCALIDSDLSRAEALCGQFGTARAFTSQVAAYAARPIDLTIVASPPGLHREHCTVALRAGSHVLCEKPLATRAADARALVEESKVAGRLLAVGMSRRFFPSLAEAAALLARGELGDGLEFACREGGGYAWPVATDAPFRRELSGGGVLMDRGVHVLDTLLALLGTPKVEAAFDDSQRRGVEANSLVRLRCGDARGFVQLSWENEFSNALLIRGSAGELKLNSGEHLHYYRRPPGGDWRKIRADIRWADGLGIAPSRSLPESYESCIYFEIVQVLRAITYGESVPVDAAQASDVIQAIEDAYTMARPLPAPWLPAVEQERLCAGHWRAHP